MKKVIGFHSPDEPYGYLSNWYLSDLTVDGQRFSSMEQYMMTQKAQLFGDSKTAAKILATDNVGKIKALGRAVQPYDDLVWNGLRQLIVYDGLLAKFAQNEELKEKLLAANRAGMRTVIVPAENRLDVGEISEEIKQGMEIVYAESMRDVLKVALERA